MFSNTAFEGSFEYVPSYNFHGIDKFDYHAFDGLNYSNAATVTIIVNSVNDIPIAGDDLYVNAKKKFDDKELLS